MCMFCAAIPAAAAVGAKLNAKQRNEIRASEESGENVQEKPIKVMTAGVLVLLVIGSMVYHSRFNSFI